MTLKRPKSLIEQNELIRCPEYLMTNDGRKLGITAWEPRLAMDDCVSVKIEAKFIINDPAPEPKP